MIVKVSYPDQCDSCNSHRERMPEMVLEALPAVQTRVQLLGFFYLVGAVHLHALSNRSTTYSVHLIHMDI